MGVTLFYNTECPDCARRARCTARLDWLRRVRISTDDSPMGPVSRGPYGLLLHIPPVRRIAGRGKQGCNGDASRSDRWLVAGSP